MNAVVRELQVMRSAKNGDPIAINDRIKTIVFGFDVDDKCVVTRAQPVNKDSRQIITHIPWTWRDAQSLISTGDWIVVTNRDMMADMPKGGETLEGGAW